MTRQTKVTIETESLLILQARTSNRRWCPACGLEGEMIALENLGVVSNLEEAAVEQWLNSSALHRSSAPDGSTLICLNSLLARVHTQQLSDRSAVADAKESK